MKKIKNNDPFLIEELREKYAKDGNIKQFCKLYSSNLVEIPNINVGRKWDMLNRKNKLSLVKSPIFNDKNSIILKLLYQKKGNLLDVGFGNGFIENKLIAPNLKFYGIDISRESVAKLNSKVKGVFKKGSVLKIPFKSNFFDFVLILDVLEHVSANKTFKALKELTRVLKNNGCLMVSVPLNEGLKKLVNSGYNPSMHVREYTPNILKFELKLFDYRIEKEYLLYAFKKYYMIKKILTKLFFKTRKTPNLYIVIASKQ